MLKSKTTLKPFPLLALGLSLGSLPALGDTGYAERSYSTPTLGTTSGAAAGGGNIQSTQTIAAEANVTVLGTSLSALSGQIQSPSLLSSDGSAAAAAATTGGSGSGTCGSSGNSSDPNGTTIGGTTYTTIYSFGLAVFHNAFSICQNGVNNITVGLAPTEIAVPFIVYPVGPLTLDVAGGARFQASLSATLSPELAWPLVNSGLQVQLQAKALAAGFVEAFAAIPLLRAGIGGQVDLLDGELDIDGQIMFNALNKPAVTINGIVQFFNGSIYAFLDVLGFLTVGWYRILDKDLYSWTAICYSMGGIQCPAK